MVFALLVALVVGAAVTGVIVTRDDTRADASVAADLDQVQASCGDWMASSQAGSQPGDDWCTDMFAWMSHQSGGSMMGSMMWEGPEQLGRNWMMQRR